MDKLTQILEHDLCPECQRKLSKMWNGDTDQLDYRCIPCGKHYVSLAITFQSIDQTSKETPIKTSIAPELKSAIENHKLETDMVNHPSHYNQGQFEVIDVIEDWNLGFSLGNAVKYIARANHKHKKLEDLKKAQWYLNREITNTENTITKGSHVEMH